MFHEFEFMGSDPWQRIMYKLMHEHSDKQEYLLGMIIVIIGVIILIRTSFLTGSKLPSF